MNPRPEYCPAQGSVGSNCCSTNRATPCTLKPTPEGPQAARQGSRGLRGLEGPGQGGPYSRLNMQEHERHLVAHICVSAPVRASADTYPAGKGEGSLRGCQAAASVDKERWWMLAHVRAHKVDSEGLGGGLNEHRVCLLGYPIAV